MKECSRSLVSVVIPVLNEEEYLTNFLLSIHKQDYPNDCLQFIFVDGGSVDNTIPMLKKWIEESNKNGVVLLNEEKTAPYAMNQGIKASNGEIIVRLDAHSKYPQNYISKCIYYLKNTDADNVGCPWTIKGEGLIGSCIEKVLTSQFGVGGSSYRIGNEAYKKGFVEYVDTVPFGTFERALVDKIGFFDVNYPRAEDNDFNYRIRKNGGKCLLFKDIYVTYYCRKSYSGLVKMGFGNGYSIGSIFHKNPEIVKIKYFIPMFFFISVILGLFCLMIDSIPNFLKNVFLTECIMYVLCDIYFSLKCKSSLLCSVIIASLFLILHLCYGAGTLLGLIKWRWSNDD